MLFLTNQKMISKIKKVIKLVKSNTWYDRPDDNTFKSMSPADFDSMIKVIADDNNLRAYDRIKLYNTLWKMAGEP